jgi:WD40 repeat protein
MPVLQTQAATAAAAAAAAAQPNGGDAPRVSLERVIGNTVVRSASLAANPAADELAYISGCVVVVYTPRSGRQTRFLSANPALLAPVPAEPSSPTSTALPPNSRLRALSCVAYGPSGRHVAAGETGRAPAVHVWDAVSGALVVSLRGTHINGISCVAFHPNQRLLVSVGG